MPYSGLTFTSTAASQASVHFVADILVERFTRRYPVAAELIDSSPLSAFEELDDIELEWSIEPLRTSCGISGTYTDSVIPPRIIVYESGNAKRDAFTVLHEVGHHLLKSDSKYQYQVTVGLGKKSTKVEEDIVNAFASKVLLPETVAGRHFTNGVTASSLLELIVEANASASACAVRALHEPGDRLILLSTETSGTFFSVSNGQPYNPGINVHQPAIERGASVAQKSGAAHQFTGAEGLRYQSGNSYTDVRFDIAVDGDLVITVVTPDSGHSRIFGIEPWSAECTSCLADYVPSEASTCSRCQRSECPECGHCDCRPSVSLCDICYLELSVSESTDGRSVHSECE